MKLSYISLLILSFGLTACGEGLSTQADLNRQNSLGFLGTTYDMLSAAFYLTTTLVNTEAPVFLQGGDNDTEEDGTLCRPDELVVDDQRRGNKVSGRVVVTLDDCDDGETKVRGKITYDISVVDQYNISLNANIDSLYIQSATDTMMFSGATTYLEHVDGGLIEGNISAYSENLGLSFKVTDLKINNHLAYEYVTASGKIYRSDSGYVEMSYASATSTMTFLGKDNTLLQGVHYPLAASLPEFIESYDLALSDSHTGAYEYRTSVPAWDLFNLPYLDASDYADVDGASDDFTEEFEALKQWNTFRGGAGQSGYVPISLDAGNFALRWQQDFDFSLFNTVSDQNNVYVVENQDFTRLTSTDLPTDAKIYALDVLSGNVSWQQDITSLFGIIDDPSKRQVDFTPPAHDNGMVYINSKLSETDGFNLLALNSTTGAVEFLIEGLDYRPFEKAAVTPYDGDIFVIARGNTTLYSFDGADGHHNWEVKFPSNTVGRVPAVGQNQVFVAEHYNGPELYSIERETGNLQFQHPLVCDSPDGSISASGPEAVAIGPEQTVILPSNDCLGKLDVYSNKMLGPEPWKHYDSNGNNEFFVLGDNAVFLMKRAPWVLNKYNYITGENLGVWSAPETSFTYLSMLSTKTHVFISSSTHTYALDANTMELEWTYPAGGYLSLNDIGILLISSQTNNAIGGAQNIGSVIAIDLQ